MLARVVLALHRVPALCALFLAFPPQTLTGTSGRKPATSHACLIFNSYPFLRTVTNPTPMPSPGVPTLPVRFPLTATPGSTIT
jgi:hypothetical protein